MVITSLISKMLFDEATKLGHWSEESKATLKKWLGMGDEKIKLQEDQFQLSKRGIFVQALKSGHDVHITELEIIVEKVRWVLEVLEDDKVGLRIFSCCKLISTC